MLAEETSLRSLSLVSTLWFNLFTKILEIIPIESNLTLVTSAVHMTRAKMLFEKAGFNIVAFPIKFFSGHKTTPMSFIPSALALHRNSKIYREFQGRLFYHLKHLLK